MADHQLTGERCTGFYQRTRVATVNYRGDPVAVSGWAQCEHPLGHPAEEPCGPVTVDQ